MRVNVVGAGYVGLVTAAGLSSLGHDVCVIESAPDRRAIVDGGAAPFHEPGLDDLLVAALTAGRLWSAESIATARDAQVWFIAVGTPSVEHRIDLSAVLDATREIGRRIAVTDHSSVVVVRSTVVPGTTQGPVHRALAEALGEPIGERVGLCVQPEFLREGTAVDDFTNPDRVVIGGADQWAREIVASLVAPLGGEVIHTTTTTAEMIKYASNALLATLVSFANEIAAICEHTDDVDAREVMSATSLDRRWAVGSGRPEMLSYLRAGGGFGGSCLPKDVEALSSMARDRGVDPYVLDAVLSRNAQRPRHLADLCTGALGDLHGRTIAVLGLAFKPGTDDLRRSPSLALIEELLARGARVRAHDPLATGAARHVVAATVELFDDVITCVAGVDGVVIATAWPEYRSIEWDAVLDRSMHPVVVDGRDALNGTTLPSWIDHRTVGRNFDHQGALT